MAKISVVTPVYNEEGNIELMAQAIQSVMEKIGESDFELIYIDNDSTDLTRSKIKALAQSDQRIKAIFNTRNFGHIRSPYHGVLQASGECVVLMSGDLQEPPELIFDFFQKWKQGFKVVLGVKNQSEESFAMFFLRRMYYDILFLLSDVKLSKNNTGFGLYDREVVEKVRDVKDPYPYFRGLISELGYERAEVSYTQRARKRGLSKNNFYTLLDIALLGLTSHTKVPLRIVTIGGAFLSLLFFLIAMGYFCAKLMWWDSFQLGLAPILIGTFFFFSVQVFFMGIIGEYIGAVHTHTLARPPVVEKKRINFS